MKTSLELKNRVILYISFFLVFGLVALQGVAEAAVTMPEVDSLAPLTDQIVFPADVAVDQYGRTYIAAASQNSVTILDQRGTYVGKMFITQPLTVAVDPDGGVLIGTAADGSVSVFDSSLGFLYKLGQGNDEFISPVDIAVDSTGNIYVVDKDSDSLRTYDSSGAYTGSIGTPGNGDGQLHRPISVAIDENAGEIVVLDLQQIYDSTKQAMVDGARIQYFDMNGVSLRAYSKFGYNRATDPDTGLPVTDITMGQMISPKEIAVDAMSRIYVTAARLQRVMVYDNYDNFLGAININNVGGFLPNPKGLTIGTSGKLYVAANQANTIEVFGLGDYTAMLTTPAEVQFNVVENGSVPLSQEVTITNQGKAVINFTAEPLDGWISVAATNTTLGVAETGYIDITVDQTGLVPGEYTGSVKIDTGAGAIETITVILNVEPNSLQVAPVITSGPTLYSISDTKAVVYWTTDELSDALVRFGTTSGALNLQTGNIEDALEHMIVLTDLTPSTTYYYTVESIDPSDNGPTVSSELSFSTSAVPDTTAPGFTVNPQTTIRTETQAVVEWSTDEPATTVLRYGRTSGNLDKYISIEGLVFDHKLTLTNLFQGTTYYFSADATDISGNTGSSTEDSFITLGISPPDTDGDGLYDIEDNCPNTSNTDQADTDGDGTGDSCDICAGFDDGADVDSDGVPDGCDNCVSTPNADQTDGDGDEVGDVCDIDIDGDGFEGPLGDNTDCNDFNAAINPNAVEIINDNVDQNCDSQELCYKDSDNDGYRPDDISTVLSANLVCTDSGEAVNSDPTTDCDDTKANVNPVATELCDGLDNDCNGAFDDNLTALNNTLTAGVCAGSKQTCDGANGWIDNYAGIPAYEEIEVTCDAKDNDCNGAVDDNLTALNNTLTAGVCAGSKQTCDGANGWIDNYAGIPAYEEIEVTCDAQDNDCNGAVDDNLTALNNTLTAGVCAGSKQTCDGANGWIDNYAGIPAYEEIEVTCDAKDNDCNGAVDDNLTALDNTLTAGVCAGSKQTCDGANGWIDNYAGIPAYEEIEVTCDGKDNDCNGAVDETLTTTYYQDSDADTYGNAAVSQDACSQSVGYVLDNSDCDDSDIDINPGATEICDSIDNNCDTQIDENKVCSEDFWFLMLPAILNSAGSTP